MATVAAATAACAKVVAARFLRVGPRRGTARLPAARGPIENGDGINGQRLDKRSRHDSLIVQGKGDDLGSAALKEVDEGRETRVLHRHTITQPDHLVDHS